jgi:hypothetical protein
VRLPAKPPRRKSATGMQWPGGHRPNPVMQPCCQRMECPRQPSCCAALQCRWNLASAEVLHATTSQDLLCLPPPHVTHVHMLASNTCWQATHAGRQRMLAGNTCWQATHPSIHPSTIAAVCGLSHASIHMLKQYRNNRVRNTVKQGKANPLGVVRCTKVWRHALHCSGRMRGPRR